MWYLIIARDHPDSLTRRIAARTDHLARLRELDRLGRLKIAGPIPAIDSAEPGAAGFAGSMLVVAFESLVAAKAWAEDDPYLHAGVYRSVEVQPYLPILP